MPAYLILVLKLNYVLITGAKFRTSSEKGPNVQPNELSSTSSSENRCKPNDNNLEQLNNETLDLADLDLSQLRLTKKDLETLSSITPSLPKHFQEQLLAQLPPNQARKLSRTLSMQTSGPSPYVYKRSLSSGRDALPSDEPSALKTLHLLDNENPSNETSGLLSFDRNSVLRRSMSRTRDQSSTHRRSTSALRSEFPCRLSYTGDLRSDHNATRTNDSLASRYRLTGYTSGTTKPEYYSKLPLPTSTAVSPQKSPSHETLESPIRRRSSQRGYSYFPRADIYGSSSSINNASNENDVLKFRKDKESEAQHVLREIRERSRDRSSVNLNRSESVPQEAENQIVSVEPVSYKDRRKSSIPNIRIAVDKQNGRICHTRNKTTERHCDIDDSTKIAEKDKVQNRRANVFPQARLAHDQNQSNSDFTDEIIGELVRRSKEYIENGDHLKAEEKKTDNGTVKKIKTKTKDGKKLKPKIKSADSTDQQTVNIKVNSSKMLLDSSNEIQSVTLPLPKSKIARRKSYPDKEESEQDKVNMDKKNDTEVDISDQNSSVAITKPNDVKQDGKTSMHSKLTPPKETLKTKKSNATNSVSSSGNTRNALTVAMEKFIEKSTERLSPGKSVSSVNAKHDTEDASPPKTKKKVKVVKKSSNQSPSKEASSNQTNETSNETSPIKETKSPEKKLKSGFLYSIGQKFEKMRENSKNKEKEKRDNKTNEMVVATKMESEAKLPTNSVKDTKDVDVMQTIIIPRGVKDGHGEVIKQEEITIRQIDLPVPISKAEQRKSRIDAVIRNLRERSVPHTVRAEDHETYLATESGLLKRAVSVEDMSNGMVNFNKSNVNKVLGLFRRIEKEHQLQKQQQSHASTSNCDQISKERPKSGGFVSKMKKSGRPYYTGAKSDTIITLTDKIERQYLSERANQISSNTKIPLLRPLSNTKAETLSEPVPNSIKESQNLENIQCESGLTLDKIQMTDTKLRVVVTNETPKSSITTTVPASNTISEKERIRNNRKGLVLDLCNEQYNDQFKKIPNDCINNNNSYNFNTNGKPVGAQCNGSSSDNHVNNNIYANSNYYHQFYPHSERNCDTFTPTTCDLTSSYSSDNRSTRDDCESTSTFLSPTEEPELCFDDWSACSGELKPYTHKRKLRFPNDNLYEIEEFISQNWLSFLND